MLTHGEAERRLRAELSRASIKVGKLRRHTTATVDVGPPHDIVIDPQNGALLDCVVHELVHAAFYQELLRWGRLEEVVVEALEDELVRYINRSKARMDWWRKAINERLAAED